MLPVEQFLRITLVIRNRLHCVPFSAFSGFLSVRLVAAGAARLGSVCGHLQNNIDLVSRVGSRTNA